MIINPIIPIWLMAIICVVFLILKPNNKFDFLRRIVIVILIFVINLRIMIYTPSKSATVENDLNVLFVIDNSISMVADDYGKNSTRLEGLKKDCNYIIDELYGAEYSVITFSVVSNIFIPFTSDANLASNTIDAITNTDYSYSRGSTLNSPIEDMQKQLKKSYEEENKKTILFFISDGEITNEDKLESFSGLAKYIDNGAVLGYGTDKRWKNVN